MHSSGRNHETCDCGNSTAFRIYIRLRGDIVAAVMDEVFAAAQADEEPSVGLPGRRGAPVVRADQMFAALREDHRDRAEGGRRLWMRNFGCRRFLG